MFDSIDCTNFNNKRVIESMSKNHIHEMQEMMIAKHVECIICEIRMVDVADYIAFIHFERHGNIADLIDTATELFFYPNSLRYANNSTYDLDWDTSPTITFEMEFCCEGITAYFNLILSAENFFIVLDSIVFENPSDDETNMRNLVYALNEAKIKKNKKLLL